MKLRRVWNQAQASQPRVTRLLTLCAFFAAGIVLGQVVQPAVTAGDLADYLRRYAGLVAENGPTQASLPMAAAAYLREPAVIFLLCFCTFGAAVIPLVCLWQGFTLSFAVACFAASLGRDGVLLSLAAFGIRGVILIPCTLLTAQWAFDKALARLLGEKAALSRRGPLAACLALLLLGAVLEVIAVPRLFALLLTKLS